ncbi:MAG: ABC transporter ATP-binding protein [Myxococcales bacterium]|nr:MAG: ABC transporter ATP-binding protein [Myxococcales bacterium]
MSLIVLENVSLGFGARRLFENLNLRVGEEDRIGVIGRNGSGKSSLLRIIASVGEPNSGSIRKAGGLRIGYLPQELELHGARSVIDSVLSSVPGKAEIESMLETVEDGLASTVHENELMELSQKLADLHEGLAHFDATYSRHEALQILSGLGFREQDHQRDTSELSGGWRMRVVLASLLFQKPDLLLLDEPTNHLDVPSVSWLAEFLGRYRGAFMLICHDREFLNEQISSVVAVESDGVRQYPGDYDAYRAARSEEVTILERRAANVAREREQAERFIRRFRSQATKARAVQSRVKALQRMESVALPGSERSLAFRFPPCGRAGQDVVRLDAVGHRYGETHVFSGIDLTARRGDRIAIVGANGNGKTTLLKIMAGAFDPTEGKVIRGHNVKIGYYAQHVTEQLDIRSTIFEEVWRTSSADDLTFVRTALGTMLFSDDEVDKPIAILSGGEKARVELAGLLVNPGNVILMDEPTNHLDLESSEALAAALETFTGTLVFVSHNRSFVHRLATRVWDVDGGGVEEFPGTFTEYLHRCARLEKEERTRTQAAVGLDATAAAAVSTVRGRESTGESSATSRAGGRARRKSPGEGRARRGLERKIKELEERIAALETEQAERSAELSKPETYGDAERYHQLLNAYRDDAAKLEDLMGRWERTIVG